MGPVRWRRRSIPLRPSAVWVPRDRVPAQAWARDARLPRWRAVALPDGLVVLGSELPWAEGATWLGADPDAPTLLLPTRLEPDHPVDLVASAIERAVPHGRPPVVVLPHLDLLIPVGRPGHIDAERLRAWGRS